MTATQRSYYLCIREFCDKNGYFPSFEVIGKRMGVTSSSTVHKMIQCLFNEGYLTKIGRHYTIVPEKMMGLLRCDSGHPMIWYAVDPCPLCLTLYRLREAQKPSLLSSVLEGGVSESSKTNSMGGG